MTATYNSKHGIVSRPPFELYMGFVDLRNLVQMLPDDRKTGISVTYDTLNVNVQGYDIGVKVAERIPYSKLAFVDDGAPFEFRLEMYFEDAGDSRTDFSIRLDANLNMMMRMVLGSKLQQAIDQVVDGLVAVSEGRQPDMNL